VSTVTFIEIQSDQAGQRIDNFLLTHLKDVPKSHVYRIIRTGQVRVNKGRIKQVYRLQAGDVVRIPPLQRAEPSDAPQPSKRTADSLRQAILYEDETLLILNKPSGLAVHGGSGISLGVIEGLRALYPKHAYLELAHRLDRDTSGCLMIAKKPAMLREIQALLRAQNGIRKHYLALVQGTWPAELKKIDLPLRKNTLASGERMVRVDVNGKAAESRFRVVRRLPGATLLEIELLSGRTHQIRVHAAHAGHPLAGDDKYGDAQFNKAMREIGLKRLFLHASHLTLRLPKQAPFSIEAPLPEALHKVLHKLGS
jgi:23S rRNA pseudouridine955/2504/2580 synthase